MSSCRSWASTIACACARPVRCRPAPEAIRGMAGVREVDVADGAIDVLIESAGRLGWYRFCPRSATPA